MRLWGAGRWSEAGKVDRCLESGEASGQRPLGCAEMSWCLVLSCCFSHGSPSGKYIDTVLQLRKLKGK